MEELTGRQRRRLRALAHHLEPVVQLGAQGLTEAVTEEIGRSLEAHELIKVRLGGGREQKAAAVAALEERLGCRCVERIGHVAVLYRRHPDPGARRIEL